jgi:hypothetical protein
LVITAFKFEMAAVPTPTPALFIKDSDIELLSNPDVQPLVVECMPFVRNKLNKGIKYVNHSIFGKNRQKGDPWPKNTTLLCMHDCSPFDTVPIPLVHRFDDTRGIYYVYGVFCSVNCAKAYVLEHEQGTTTRRMIDFHHMMRSIFGIRGTDKPAPPRFRLKIFGGDLTIESFRSNFHTVHTELLRPPFVPSPSVYKELSDEALQENHNEMFDDKPKKNEHKEESQVPAPSLFATFLASQPVLAKIVPVEEKPIKFVPVEVQPSILMTAPLAPPVTLSPKLPEQNLAPKEVVAKLNPKPKNKRSHKALVKKEPKIDNGSLAAFINFR